MSRLPVVSGREAVKAFERVGYAVDRQKGSHIQLRQVAAPTSGTPASRWRSSGTC